MGFVHPTPVQSATVPVALSGRDVCGCASTGTGKTAAYMLPILERLLLRAGAGAAAAAASTCVLVLVPTRELGVQVYQVRGLEASAARCQIDLFLCLWPKKKTNKTCSKKALLKNTFIYSILSFFLKINAEHFFFSFLTL